MSKARPKKPEQKVIPGTDRDRIPALDKVMFGLFEIQEARCDLSKQEHEHKTKGYELLKQHNRKSYRSQNSDGETMELYIPEEETSKVRKVPRPKPKLEEATVE